MRVILILLGLFTVGSSLAQESRTYTCGPDYQPADIAFGPDGTLYSTDGHLLEWGIEYLRPGTCIDTQAERRGFVYRHDALGCVAIAEGAVEVFGLTVTPDGRVCAGFTDDAGAVRCWDGSAWNDVYVEPYFSSNGGAT